jgi:hypothetical protein
VFEHGGGETKVADGHTRPPDSELSMISMGVVPTLKWNMACPFKNE